MIELVIADWGGPQWVLATLLLIGMVAPIGRRFAPSDGVDVSDTQWWGQYLGIQLVKGALVALLAWGGFW